jgi:choline dehydrogenase-like flavoprotein
MAAWNLTRQGVDVVMLDAGEKFDKSKSWEHVPPGTATGRCIGASAPFSGSSTSASSRT